MNNKDFKFRFFPKKVKDERGIYRVTPVAWMDSSVVLLNRSGAILCKSDGGAIPIDLPDGDEVLLGQDGVVYACWFDENKFIVRTYHYEDDSFKDTGRLYTILIQDIPAEELVILSTPKGVELWWDAPESCKRMWSISDGSAKKNPAIVIQRPEGELLFSSGELVGFSEDCGVRGIFLSIVNLNTQNTWRIRSEFAFSALGRVFAISNSDPADSDEHYGLHVFTQSDDMFLEVDGPILEAAGNSIRAVISVFTGGDAELRDIIENNSGDLEMRRLDSPTGYKSLSLDGSVYAVRGFAEALTIASTPDLGQPLLSPCSPDSVSPSHSSYEKYVTSQTSSQPLGAVIHFHGGPESQEVPEGRLFGLPQWCNKQGLDWIGVNYQGSLMPDRFYTRSAWHRWRSAMLEDLEGALELASGSVVLAGWSFGATLALALGASSE